MLGNTFHLFLRPGGELIAGLGGLHGFMAVSYTHLDVYKRQLLEREVSQLNAILADPERPFVAVLGGSKVTDKIAVIERFLDIADTLLIGGAMCFPFLQVQGHPVGDSMCEVEGLEPAQSALEKAATARAALVLPSDLGLGEHYAPDAPRRDIDDVEVPPGWMGLDIGPRTARLYAELIDGGATIFWLSLIHI